MASAWPPTVRPEGCGKARYEQGSWGARAVRDLEGSVVKGPLEPGSPVPGLPESPRGRGNFRQRVPLLLPEATPKPRDTPAAPVPPPPTPNTRRLFGFWYPQPGALSSSCHLFALVGRSHPLMCRGARDGWRAHEARISAREYAAIIYKCDLAQRQPWK